MEKDKNYYKISAIPECLCLGTGLLCFESWSVFKPLIVTVSEIYSINFLLFIFLFIFLLLLIFRLHSYTLSLQLLYRYFMFTF